jgi:hypothetical protein
LTISKDLLAASRGKEGILYAATAKMSAYMIRVST